MLPKVRLLQKFVEGGVIAVIRKVPNKSIEKVAEALVEGGITALEITVDTPYSFDTIRTLSQYFQEKAVVGAGTVLDGYSAYQAIQCGADFIFSPNLNLETIRTTLRYGKIAIPGVTTPTEAITAIEAGADAIKLFPASSVGYQFIKDMQGPFPYIPIIPTGGIGLDNMTSYIKAGAVSVGVGGNLVDRKAIESGDYHFIKELATEFIRKVHEIRATN